MPKTIIQEWADKIDWKSRVKAVCKPCWELKYCPYGPLVEQFPLDKKRTEMACRIFGHNCPVFYSAEPFTETKELRRISRAIPREIQFKILKRDNQICQICKRNVLEDEIHFDHIIPYSKGGPTEVHNIRLLCSDCNRTKSNKFEDEYLVNNFFELTTKPLEINFIELFLSTMAFYYSYQVQNGNEPTTKEYLDDNDDDIETAEFIEDIVHKFISLFEKNEYEIPSSLFKIIKNRWGLLDGIVKSFKDLKIEEGGLKGYFLNEIKLFSYIGIYLDNSERSYKKWKSF